MIYADRFVRGPFHLGRLSLVIASTAVLWIAFIAVVFCLPQLNPVNAQTLNYAPVAVAIVVLYSLGFWFVSARKWFTGPIRQIDGGKFSYVHTRNWVRIELTTIGWQRKKILVSIL